MVRRTFSLKSHRQARRVNPICYILAIVESAQEAISASKIDSNLTVRGFTFCCLTLTFINHRERYFSTEIIQSGFTPDVTEKEAERFLHEKEGL